MVPGHAACSRANSPVSRSDWIAVIHGGSKIASVRRKGNAEPLLGRHLHDDREVGAVVDEPGDHREQLDHQSDAPSLEIVEGSAMPV